MMLWNPKRCAMSLEVGFQWVWSRWVWMEEEGVEETANALTVAEVGACPRQGSRKRAQDCRATMVITLLRGVMLAPSGRYFVKVNLRAGVGHFVAAKLGVGHSKTSEYEMSVAEMTEGLVGFPAAASA